MGVAGRSFAVVRFLQLLAVFGHEIAPERNVYGGKSLARCDCDEKRSASNFERHTLIVVRYCDESGYSDHGNKKA